MTISSNFKSICVLPFLNRSPGKGTDHFADGITEEIINALTKIDGLRVTSRTSSFFYKNKEFTIPEIHSKLKVQLVIEGSIRIIKNKIRVKAQMIDAIDDFQLWSEVWNREIDDVFSIEDELSLMIAEKSREYLGHFELKGQMVVSRTNNLKAYDYFLRGRYHFRKWNQQDAQKAIEFYEKAINIEPSNAEYLVAKADALGFLATTGVLDFVKSWKEIKILVDRALTINNQLADAYYQLANYHFFVSCDFRLSLEAALTGKKKNNNHPETNQFLSFLYILAGNKKESRKYLNHCLSVDPLSQETRFFDAYFYYMIHEFELALEKLDNILNENAFNVPAHGVKAYTLIKLKRYDEALNYFDTIPQEVVVEEDRLGVETIAHILNQEDEKSEMGIQELEKRAQHPEGFRSDSFLPFIYAVKGEKEKAFQWIEKAISNRSNLLLIQLNDPILSNIKGTEEHEFYLKQVFGSELYFNERKDNLKLQKDEIPKYMERLRKVMVEEKLFLLQDLSLKNVAKKIDLSANKLSWLINFKFDKNFNQFVNEYRLSHFKELVKQPDNSKFSILGLAYESGFNSKTAFNTYFKKSTGSTPKAWIENL